MLDPLLRAKAVKEAWETGSLYYLLRPSQRKIYDARTQIKHQSRKFIFCCGRGWGKSFLLLASCAETALRYPGSDSVFVAPVQRKVSEYLEPIARDVFKDCPESLRPRFYQADLVYKFPNGSRIMVCGSNQKGFDNIRGGTFKKAAVDEGAYHDYLIELIERVLMPALNKGNGDLEMGSTPPDVEHPFDQRYCTEAELGGYYFHATIHDAGYPEDQIAEFKREAGWVEREKRWRSPAHELTWRVEYLAERGLRNPDKTIIPGWDDKYVRDIRHDQYYPFFYKAVSLDVGTKHDLTVALFGYYHYLNAQLVIEDEFSIAGPEFTTLKLSSAIKVKERNLWGSQQPVLRTSDISDIQADLNLTHGLPFSSAAKLELHAMVNRLNLLVEAGRLAVHPRCKLLIQTLKNGIWDKNRTEFGRSEIGLGHMDALAALIYMNLAFESWYNINPIPIGSPTFTNIDMHGTYGKVNESIWTKVFSDPQKVEPKEEDHMPEIENNGDWEL
jgi:hypothetical protein